MKERLKELRKFLGLTQQDFADRLNIKRTNIASYESGKSNLGDALYGGAVDRQHGGVGYLFGRHHGTCFV